MLKKILILVVLAVGILALVLFYKASSFELTLNSLILKTQRDGVVYPYQKIRRDIKTLSNVKINQYSLTTDGEDIIYEIAEVDGLYEFNDNPKIIVSKIFDAKDSRSLFANNGLEALQLTLSDGRVLNLFMVQTDSKKIEFLYGLSDKLFAKSVKQLSGKSVEVIGAVVLSKPLTKWSEEITGIDGVISSIDH